MVLHRFLKTSRNLANSLSMTASWVNKSNITRERHTLNLGAAGIRTHNLRIRSQTQIHNTNINYRPNATKKKHSYIFFYSV